MGFEKNRPYVHVDMSSEVKNKLKDKPSIKIFNQLPTTAELGAGEIGLVLEEAISWKSLMSYAFSGTSGNSLDVSKVNVIQREETAGAIDTSNTYAQIASSGADGELFVSNTDNSTKVEIATLAATGTLDASSNQYRISGELDVSSLSDSNDRIGLYIEDGSSTIINQQSHTISIFVQAIGDGTAALNVRKRISGVHTNLIQETITLANYSGKIPFTLEINGQRIKATFDNVEKYNSASDEGFNSAWLSDVRASVSRMSDSTAGYQNPTLVDNFIVEQYY